MSMKLVTNEIRTKLLRNSARQGVDHEPVVKLFNPCGAAIWLFTEVSPDNTDLLFGLCDLGMGFPELGYASLAEIEAVRLPMELGIERDLGFQARHPLSAYAKAARSAGRIVENNAELDQAATEVAETEEKASAEFDGALA